MITFQSDLFDTHPTYQALKSHFLDLYNGHSLPEVPLTALEHVISITAGPMTESNPLPLVHFRVYTVKLLSSGSKVPRIQLTEMGPSIDFSMRRIQEADGEMLRAALKRAKIEKKVVESGLGRKRKNIETDGMGDRVGRLHLDKQDLSKMQGRKMKGLKAGKKSKEQDVETPVAE